MTSNNKLAILNPLKNGFFLVALWSFGLAFLLQRWGRYITIDLVQQQVVGQLNEQMMQSNGIYQDISVACYYSLIVLLIGLLPWRLLLIQWLQGLFVFSQCLLFLTDINLLHAWNSRINELAISMIFFPNAIIQSLSHREWLCVVCIVPVLLFVLWLLAKAVERMLQNNDAHFRGFGWWAIMFTGAAVGARGGIQKIPLNIGNAHLSALEIENILSINPNWNLFSVINQPNLKLRTEKAKMNSGVEDFAMQQYMGPDSFPGGLKRMPQIIRKGSNVLFVILEGINQHWLESGNQTELRNTHTNNIRVQLGLNEMPSQTAMPNLVALAQSGMWYKKAYASGDRTDKGLASIFTAWPSQPWEGILMQPNRWHILANQKLPAAFGKAGYSTQFIYGGDPNFANMGAFLKFVGFDSVVCPPQAIAQNWGLADRKMVPKVISSIKSMKRPFFAAWLTLSSHEPYDVVDNDGLTQAQKLRKSIEYTDQAIGDLVLGLKAANLYDSTVIVFVSDHGKTVGLPITEDYEQEFFRIPLIITGEPIRDMYRGVAPHIIVSQTDIYATLAEQLLGILDGVPFSRNMYFANHPGMAICFTEGKSVLAANGFRHHLFLQHFNQLTASDSIVLGLQSKIIREYFKP